MAYATYTVDAPTLNDTPLALGFVSRVNAILAANPTARVTGFSVVWGESYRVEITLDTGAGISLTSPLMIKGFRAQIPDLARAQLAAFIAANPTYYISPATLVVVDSKRDISAATLFVLYSSDASAGSNVGMPVVPSAHAATHLAGGADAVNWTLVNGKGDTASRPAAGPTNAGYLYYNTDDSELQRSSGVAWESVSSSSGTTSNITYVDAVIGNNATAAQSDFTKPYLTIEAAVAAASAGTTVEVRPGSYAPASTISKAGVSVLCAPGVIITPAATVNLISNTSGTFRISGGARIVLTAATARMFDIIASLDGAYYVEVASLEIATDTADRCSPGSVGAGVFVLKPSVVTSAGAGGTNAQVSTGASTTANVTIVVDKWECSAGAPLRITSTGPCHAQVGYFVLSDRGITLNGGHLSFGSIKMTGGFPAIDLSNSGFARGGIITHTGNSSALRVNANHVSVEWLGSAVVDSIDHSGSANAVTLIGRAYAMVGSIIHRVANTQATVAMSEMSRIRVGQLLKMHTSGAAFSVDGTNCHIECAKAEAPTGVTILSGSSKVTVLDSFLKVSIAGVAFNGGTSSVAVLQNCIVGESTVAAVPVTASIGSGHSVILMGSTLITSAANCITTSAALTLKVLTSSAANKPLGAMVTTLVNALTVDADVAI